MTQLTKQAICAALERLLEREPFSRITVSEIAEECGISRMTFYYHFQDIYDLLEWTVNEELDAFLSEADSDDFLRGMHRFFQLLLEKKPLVHNMYHSVPRERMEEYVYRMTERILLPYVDRRLAGKRVSAEDRQCIVDFCKYAFGGFLLNWIAGGMTGNPEEILARVSALAQGGVLGTVERFPDET